MTPKYSGTKFLAIMATITMCCHSRLLKGQDYYYMPWQESPSCHSWPQQETIFYSPQCPPNYAPPNYTPSYQPQNNYPSCAKQADNKPVENGTKKEECSAANKVENAKEKETAKEPKKEPDKEPKKEADKEKEPAKEKEADKKPKEPEGPKEPAFLIPLSLGHCGYITYKPGLRIQARYAYDNRHHNHDMFIRRFRMKASGDAFKLATYGAELKIDNTGRYGADPEAEVENAWLDFTLCRNLSYLRIGLYDLPFSRDALTSDSKLLFMDRSLIKDRLTDLGLADNTIGIMLHGRPYGGRFEYAVGIFDNFKFEKFGEDGPRRGKPLMPAGRFVVNLLDPATPPEGYADYQESYIGKGHRLAIGVNAAYQGSARNEDTEFDLYAWGFDFFYNWYRFTFQAEFDWYKDDVKHHFSSSSSSYTDGDSSWSSSDDYYSESEFDWFDVDGYGWYVQAGYLFYRCYEFAVRYQELGPDENFEHEKQQWTSVGLNAYFREHNLKVQADYTFIKEHHHKDNNVFQVQLQLDF